MPDMPNDAHIDEDGARAIALKTKDYRAVTIERIAKIVNAEPSKRRLPAFAILSVLNRGADTLVQVAR
jgi:hypothetical protein